MSRSNPNTSLPHVAERWFEWSSKSKCIKYYDKEKEENILVKLPFVFLLLDELAVIKGWNAKKNDGLTSNEVRSIKTDPITVRYFKNGVIASGLWDLIKEKVTNAKGSYHTNAYIAFRGDDGKLKIGSLMLSGCALGAWIEFTKKCKNQNTDVDGKTVNVKYAKAIAIDGFESGTTGDVEWNAPKFKIMDVKPETAKEATACDVELQKYLAVYLTKNQPVKQPHSEKDEAYQPSPEDEGSQAGPGEYPEPEPEPAEEDDSGVNCDVPF